MFLVGVADVGLIIYIVHIVVFDMDSRGILGVVVSKLTLIAKAFSMAWQ